MDIKTRLHWKVIDYYQKTLIVQNELNKQKKDLYKHLKEFKKVSSFLNEINYIIDRMVSIKEILIPELEEELNLSFPTSELMLIALTRPSIRNIFSDLKIYFSQKNNCPIDLTDFDILASTGYAANVLALLGDAVLDLAVIEITWDPLISTTGELTIKRKNLVSNEKLAKVCDRFDLRSYSLKRLNDPSQRLIKGKTLDHEKGTIVEAILGVIYLERNLDGVVKVLPDLIDL
ncbi:ribonuclease III domain-containing protein [Candidatus Hodarchaeum mangrovi]